MNTQISLSAFFALLQYGVHDPKQLRQPFFTSAMTARWRLDSENVRSAIGSNHGQTSEEESIASCNFHGGCKSTDLGETIVAVYVLNVLTRDFNVIKFAVVEIGQEAVAMIELFSSGPRVQSLFIAFVPFLQSKNVFTKCDWLSNELLVHDLPEIVLCLGAKQLDLLADLRRHGVIVIPEPDLLRPLSDSVVEQRREEPVTVFFHGRFGSNVDMIDHLLHRERKQRECCLENVENFF